MDARAGWGGIVGRVRRARSGGVQAIFDAAYYLRQYPDVAEAGADPLSHFLGIGWAEGRNPCALFDTEFYLERNPDVAQAGLNPLVHYVKSGAREGRQVSLLFDAIWYLAKNPDIAGAARANPLAHYLARGAAEGREANPLFDQAWYLKRYPDALAEAPCALAHYAERGLQDRLSPHPLFDGAFYLDRYPDVARAGMNPLAHFLLRGHEEVRQPHALFDTAWYLQTYPDVAAARVNPLLHYVWEGAKEGRDPNAEFDARWYLETYPDVAKGGLNALVDYLKVGTRECRGAGYKKYATTFLTSDASSDECLALFAEGFPPISSPQVSMIVAAYNKLDYTLRCLESVRRNTTGAYEIIVVDDCSTDGTQETLQRIPNLVNVRNGENLGFLKASNRGAQAARSPVLVFLNNDTEVMADWLPPLLELVNRDCVGAVGPKLVYPDGTLQEAGAIYFQDATGANYGRGHPNPDAPQFNYVKEVDKCSGACLAVRRELFFTNGEGFDSQFAPAYKEDADLCFRVRQLGFRVMYQPASTVIHHEGVSCGTDVTRGVKKYQELNRPKFVAKWKDVLERDHLPAVRTNIPIARERPYNAKVALVIDDKVPEHDKHAGGMGMFHYTKLLLELGYKVMFVPDNKRRIEPYTGQLQQLGVEVFYGNFQLDALLNDHGRNIEVAWLSRPTEAAKHIDTIRAKTNAKILYCGRDLHFLRMRRHGEIKKCDELLLEADRMQELERQLFLKADAVLTFSVHEHALISDLAPAARARVIAPYIIEQSSALPQPEGLRTDVLFIGGFNHSPNRDAVTWFLDECWPTVRDAMPGARFVVIGADPPAPLLERAGSHAIFCGHVNEIAPYFANAIASVAPLRFGAGVKGKLITSMSHDCPVVTTAIGAEGMELSEGAHALVAETPQEFADALRMLAVNPTARAAIVAAGRDYVSARYSKRAVRRNFETILSEIGAAVPSRVFS